MKEAIELRNIGSSHGMFHVVAEENGQDVGRAIAVKIGKTAYLEDFRVQNAARKQGIGTELLHEVENLAREDGAERMVRIGMFCEADSPADYFRTVQFLRNRGYNYRIIYLSKQLTNIK